MNNTLAIIKKLFKYILLFLLMFTTVVVFIIYIQGNFYKVNDDVYRSGQLNKYNLEFYIKQYHIKSILNLRGKSTRQYYTDEIKISDKYKVNHIDYGISNRKFLDFNKTMQIINIMKSAEKPLLIHCAGGADRTSLAAALYQYALKNKSVEESREEFSIIYGHSPFFRKHVIAMDNSFLNFTKQNKGKK